MWAPTSPRASLQASHMPSRLHTKHTGSDDAVGTSCCCCARSNNCSSAASCRGAMPARTPLLLLLLLPVLLLPALSPLLMLALPSPSDKYACSAVMVSAIACSAARPGGSSSSCTNACMAARLASRGGFPLASCATAKSASSAGRRNASKFLKGDRVMMDSLRSAHDT